MKKFIKLLVAALLGTAQAVFATQHHVPQQYPTIQAAINASAHSDTVLVAPGRYHENIVFRGKNITVASHFLTTGNRTFIRTTIIDGSQPLNPDTASVVRLINNEDSTTVLAGFTITGGRGTKWPDAHHGSANPVYREGGGILCEGSSPVIRDNFIYLNQAILTTGAISAGGGGIRADGGNPRILHNIIMKNRGRYGAGIVLNYCGGIIKNNIITLNSGGEDFGGAGIWVLENGPYPKQIENNTITGNTSATNGGGVLVWTTTVTLRNNIVYGNTGGGYPQLFTQQGGLIVSSYNLVQDGDPGPGTVNAYPMFADSTGRLLTLSPAVDAGDPAGFFFDPSNPAAPTTALAPALGAIRNDIGAYGGQGSNWFIDFGQSSLAISGFFNLSGASHGTPKNVKLPFANKGLASLNIDSIKVKTNSSQFQILNTFPLTAGPVVNDTLRLIFTPAQAGLFSDTLLVFHSDSSIANPRKVRLFSSVLSSAEETVAGAIRLEQNVPNPFSGQTSVAYTLDQPAYATFTVSDALGREVFKTVQGYQQSGEYSLLFNGSQLPAGIYYYRLLLSAELGQPISITRKMVIAK